MIDEVKANRAINFIERICTHVKGDLAGKPFALEPWQREYIAQLFGTIGSDGLGKRFSLRMELVWETRFEALLAQRRFTP